MKIYEYTTGPLIFMFLLLSIGCSSFPENAGTAVVRINRENIQKLKIGDTRTTVIGIMGLPQHTAKYPRYAKHLNYWKYQMFTRPKLKFAGADEYYAFLAFEGDILVAIGAGHEVIPFNKKHPLWKPQ